MKIAVPSRNNKVDGHFGHCEYYNVYTISTDNKIENKERVDSLQGCGCKSDIAGVLSQQGVKIMLAGNMGNGALNKLNSNGIEVVRGCKGDVDRVIEDYLNGDISDSGKGCATHELHHAHGHNHSHSHAHNHKHGENNTEAHFCSH